MEIRMLDVEGVDAARPQLAALLQDAVAHGASIGFVASLDAGEADSYWRGVRDAVQDGSRLLWGAWSGGALAGTVQLDLCGRPNGANRAEVQKLMVHSAARRGGIASILMRELEAQALARRRGLLYLDTEAGSGAESLYRRLGYTRVGELPEFACSPDGTWRATAIYFKTLFPAASR